MAELDRLFYALGIKDETDKDISTIKKKLENLGSNVSLRLDSDKVVKELTTSFDRAFAQIGKSISSGLSNGMSSADSSAITKLRDEIQKKLSDISFNPSFEGAKAGLNDLIILAQRLEDHLARVPAAMEVVRKTIENVNAALAKLDSATTSAGGMNTKQQVAGMDKLAKKILEVDRMLSGVNEKRARGFLAGADVDNAVRKLETLRATLLALQSNKDAMSFKRLTSMGVIGDQIKEAQQLISLGQKQMAQETQISRDKERSAEAERKKAEAMRNTLSISQKLEQSFSMQSGILGQLGMQIGNVFSIYTIERFLQKVIETGGELEKQRLAMSSMLGSDFLSNRLMDQVQALAVKSPFGVMQLNSYAKQLVAFGVETDQLYESLKRLADIAAGVGVDMQRIAYAFGQVKSRSWLDAKELRQFAYAGIPLLEELSKYYTAAERAKGSDKTVSTSDVRGMIQNREVSFEDMRDVLWEMTDEGGRFYKMQEVMSESLAAKYKNLADSYDIMVSEIAKSNNAAFKAPAEILTVLMQNWEKLLPILGTATMLLVANKAQWYAQTIAMSLNSKAELQKLAGSRKLNVAQRLYITTSKQMTASDLAELASTGALNSSQLARLAVLKKMTAAEVDAAIANGTFARSEYVAAAAGTKAAFSLRALADSFKSFFASIGPIGWIITAAGVVWELVSAWKSSSDAEKEALRNLRQYATESADTLSSVLDNVHKSNSSGLSETRAKEEYDKAIEDLSAYYGKDGVVFIEQGLLDAEGNAIELYTERLKKLEEELENLEKYGKDPDATATAITNVFENIDDSDIKEWVEEVAYMRKQVHEFASDSPKEAREAFEAINEELKLGIEKGAPLGEYIEKIFSDDNIIVNAKRLFEKLKPSYGKISSKDFFGDGILIDYDDLNQNFRNLKEGIELEYKKVFKDDRFNIFNATSEQKAKIVADIQTKIDVDKWDDGTKEAFLNGMYRTFHWTVEVEQKGDVAFTPSGISELIKQIDQANKDLESLTGYENKAATKNKEGYTKGKQKIISNRDTNYGTLQQTYGLSKEDVDAEVAKLNAKSNNTNKKGGGENKAERQMRQYFQSLQKEINLIEKYYQRYKELSAKIGKERAAAILNGNPIFKDIVANGKAVTDYESFNKILKDELETVESARKKYGKVNGAKEQADNLASSLNEKILGNDTDSISRAVDLASKTMKAYVDELNKQYDIYKKVYETTGEQSLASMMAFGTPDAIREGAQKYRDALLDEIQKLLPGANEEILRGFYNMEPEDISASVSMREGEDEKAYAARLKNITLLTEEFRKADEKDAQERVSRYLKLVEDTYDFYDKLEQATREGEEKVRSAREMEAKIEDPEEKKRFKNEVDVMERQINANAVFDSVTSDPMFQSYSDSFMVVSKDAISNYADILRTKLITSFADGTRTASEFYAELEKINQLEYNSDNRETAFQALANNGIAGFFSNKQDVANNRTAELSQQIATARKNKYIAEKSGNTVGARIHSAEITALQKELKLSEEDAKVWGDKADKIKKASNAISKYGQSATQALSAASEMNDALGGDQSTSNTLNLVGNIVSAGMDIASGIMSMNPADILKGVMTAITSIAQFHDQQLQAKIEESKRRVEDLKSSYEDLQKVIERELGVATEEQSREALENLKKQRSEVEKQQQLESEKKKEDEDALRDYKDQLSDLDDQIKYFYEDLYADDLAANVKDWAQQISDALTEAWENGEDSARAFDKTVGEIMKNVVKSALNTAVLEPAFDRIREMLSNEGNGFLKDGFISAGERKVLIEELMKLKGYAATSDEAYNQIANDLLALGVDIRGNSQGLTGSIEGVTEETADLLASYLNAARADISIIKDYIIQYFGDEANGENSIQNQQLVQLQSIAASTERNARAAEEIHNLFVSVTDGSKKIYV